MKISGGCHCGRLRYDIDQDGLEDVANCHCAACRKTTGGTLTTWATVPLARFAWIAGKPRVYRSSPECERYFCADCGAQLALFTQLAPATIDVTIATLDDPHAYPPDRHIWVRSKLAWFPVDDGMPQEQEETL